MVQTPGQKILIIDDEEVYRTMTSATLKTMGYDIVEATDGLDGLAAVKMHHPDLVLCDINMPKMDGRTLLATLKQDPECNTIPFIFMTGNSAASDMREGMQLGADDYLTKPFTSDDLLAAIKTRLMKNKSLEKHYKSQYDDIKTSIVRSLPHEFRTPLHSILGCAQFLKEENGLTAEEVKEAGVLISKSAERLHHLLENMILFGELQFWMNDQRTIATMRRESTSLLREAVRSAAEGEAATQKRGDAIHIAVKDSPVRISEMHLTKIIEEIMNNALKFSDPGTKIDISSEENDQEVTITIQDEGRGMSPEQISGVTAFQQFDRRHYEQQGAGLGLEIAKTLAELYGGSLAIKSKEKIGTTVSLCLRKVKNN
jgi:two-component system, sensor histidine kinase and response regulator